MLDHAGESVHDAGPDTTRIGDVHAVGGVAVGVGKVEVQRPVEVLERQVVVADLGSDDRLTHADSDESPVVIGS